MQIFTLRTHEKPQDLAPAGVRPEFQLRLRNRYRRRAAQDGNILNSLLDVSRTALSRLRTSIRPVALAALCVLALSRTARADDHSQRAIPPDRQEQPATRIEVDQVENAIHFIINGKEIALIDETGFYVWGEIANTSGFTIGLPPHVQEGRYAD